MAAKRTREWPPFDARQALDVVVHDLGTARVSRCDAEGRWTTADEPRRALSVFVDGEEIIDGGLEIEGGDRLVAFNACSCGVWECNLTEGYAAGVRALGPYVFWLHPSGASYVFGRERYAEVFGAGVDTLPVLDGDDAWELDAGTGLGIYLGADGKTHASDDEDGPFGALWRWPASGAGDVHAVAPSTDAFEVVALNDGGPSLWVDAAPRADRRAAYLPGVTLAPVWCAGPSVDRLVAALVGGAGLRG